MHRFNYKKIFRSQKIRFFILNFFSFLSDSLMLKFQYRIKLGRKLNINNPKRFTEKIQYYKAYYRNPVMGICVDKYRVREYLKSKGLEMILNELLFVTDTVDDIDFEKLPNQFVIKTTDGGGGENIIICKDKKQLNFSEVKQNLKNWKNKKNINAGREWAYTQIDKSRFIVEKYLENSRNPEAGIEDYKFLCYSGVPKYVIIDKDRYIDHKRNFYTIDKKQINADSDHVQFYEPYEWPENYEEMVNIAAKLSEDFPFVRVDLYNIDGKIVFGELTFYPWSGYVQFNPDSFDEELGKDFDIGKVR